MSLSLIKILFPLLLYLVIFSFPGLVSAEECSKHENHFPLPGRLGGNFIYTEMGKTKIFFYMTPRKEEISKQLVYSINSNNIKITTDVTTPPCPVSEISLMATKFPMRISQLNKIGFDAKDSPLWLDPVGESIFDAYAEEVIQIAENVFDIKVDGRSKDLSLIANHDAVKIHKDYFSQQYEFLSQLKPPIPKYYLFQDLTLIDWTMAQSSCSGTLLQDRTSGDRFLMIMFPDEVFGAIYIEPVIDNGPMIAPTFPGPVAFPFHTALAPIDFFGCCNVGSWKGKRISVTTRGVILEEDVAQATAKSTYVPLNRPDIYFDVKDFLTRSYSNGVLIKNLHTLPILKPGICLLKEDQEHVTILEDKPERFIQAAKLLKTELGIDKEFKKVYHLSKHDGGFSRLSHILPDVSPDSTLVIVNRSIFPAGYKHFIISEDCTSKNLPWFQFYWLPQTGVMKIPASIYEYFSLSPVEEIFFRDEISDRINTEASVLSQKMTLRVDVYIFS